MRQSMISSEVVVVRLLVELGHLDGWSNAAEFNARNTLIVMMVMGNTVDRRGSVGMVTILLLLCLVID